MADSMISLMSGYSRKGLVLLHPWTMGHRHPADQAQRCWQFERSVHSALSFLFTPNQKKPNLFWVYMYRCWMDETGAIEVFVDGVSKLNVQGIELRTRGDSVFRGIQAQTFFG